MSQRFNVRQAGVGFEWYADSNGPWVPAEAHEMTLRACEERAREEMSGPLDRLITFAEGAQPTAYAAGYTAALDAATEAVAAMRPETDPDIAHVIVGDALAAIADLKEEK